MDALCQRCGKPLGWRRAAQGIRIHPACKHSLAADDVEGAIEKARAVLARTEDEDEELSPLFQRAHDEARRLLSNLRELKNYVGPAAASGGEAAAEAQRSQAPQGSRGSATPK